MEPIAMYLIFDNSHPILLITHSITLSFSITLPLSSFINYATPINSYLESILMCL